MGRKQGLQLNRVVLLGRTLEEYRRYFQLDLDSLRGKKVLDVASGVSSFCAEATSMGVEVAAADPIYVMAPEEIARRTGPDLDFVFKAIEGLNTYRWDYYKNPESMRVLRKAASDRFLEDYTLRRCAAYIPAALPHLPFESEVFDLTLVSYFLFVYQEQFNYEFHLESIRELARVTRGEIRIYPTVTFEAEESSYIARLRADSSLSHLHFEIVKTDFEFLANSNCFLRITRRA